jgi:hypothetical protein
MNCPFELSTSQRSSPQLRSSGYDMCFMVKATVHIRGAVGGMTKQDRQCTDKVILRRVHGTIIAMEKK